MVAKRPNQTDQAPRATSSRPARTGKRPESAAKRSSSLAAAGTSTTATSGSDKARPKTARATKPLKSVAPVVAAPASSAKRRGAAQAGMLRPKRRPSPAEPRKRPSRFRLGPRDTFTARRSEEATDAL